MPIKGFKSIKDQTKDAVKRIFGRESQSPRHKNTDNFTIDDNTLIPYICDETGKEFNIKWSCLQEFLNKPHCAPLEKIYPEEIEFIKNNYAKYGLKYCVNHTQLKRHTVRYIIARYNVKKKYEDLPEDHLRCRQCKTVLHISNFYSRKNSKRGFIDKCIKCRAKYAKKYRQRSIESILKERLSSIRKRAKKKKLECDLTLEWMLETLPEKCPVLNKRITLETQNRDDCVSYDRTNNNESYLKNNTLPVSNRVNILKNDSTRMERYLIYQFYENLENDKLDYQI